MIDGHRVFGACWPAMGRVGFAGAGLYQAGLTVKGSPMISLDIIYGFGGLCAALLLAYLVYALICAEEF